MTKVHVMDVPTYREWRNGRRRADMPALVEESGHTVLVLYPGNDFGWVCPGCGGFSMGTFGDVPVSGWDEPRWAREGDDEHISLSPSLGCPRWRDGTCVGHWWLRDGWLDLA